MITLRALKMEDAEYMMEFINDSEIANSFKFTRYPFSIEVFENFIKDSWTQTECVHYGIEADDYAGTISLKNIDLVDRTAEYAIIIRKKYWGTGVSKNATEEILKYGFDKLNLRKIYLNVLASNIRADKFYKKMGFEYEGIFRNHVFIDGEYEDLKWYCLFNNSKENI